MNIQCPHCGKTLSVKPESAGKKGRCPACQQIFEIPPTDAEQPAPSAAPVSPAMEESIDTDNAETAAAPDMEASINTDSAEAAAPHTGSGAEILSSRGAGIKLLKWLLIFGVLFLLVFAVTIGGLMLFAE